MEASHAFVWIALVSAFLLGSIPFGIFIARMFHVNDLREKGSGNIGATNVSRVIGFWPAGALTLFLDMLKGLIPVALLQPFGFQLWKSAAGLDHLQPSDHLIWAMGLCAVLGHCYSPWLKFKGGKGVATGLGAILLLSPLAALVGLAAFVMTFLFTRTGSLSSLAGLAAVSVAHLVLYGPGGHLWAAAAMIFVIIMRHESNIDALLENREKSF